MADHIRVAVGGLDVAVAGDQELLDTLRCVFARFPEHPPKSKKKPRRLLIEWRGNEARWRINDHRPFPLRVCDSSFRVGATQILLNQAIDWALPSVLSLHGNALYRPEKKEWLFFLGRSGAGKTTLTMGWLERPERADWRLAAEDVLLLDTEAGGLWPFPRAAGLREFGPVYPPLGPHATEPLASERALQRRMGFGLEAPLKWVESHSAERLVEDAGEALALGAADVVFVEWPDTAEVSEVSRGQDHGYWDHCRWRVYLNWASPELPDRLAERGLPKPESALRQGYFVLSFERALAEAELLRLEEEALREGGLVLLVEPAPETANGSGARAPQRPPKPRTRELDVMEGVLRLMNYLRRPSARAPRRPPGETIMKMTRLFLQARFHALVPGGTPSDTMDLLGKALDESSEPGR